MKSVVHNLKSLAKVYGIQLEYEDVKSEFHETAPEAIVSVLRTFGVPTESPQALTDALDAAENAEWTRLAEPVIVRSVSELEEDLEFQVPMAEGAGEMTVTIQVTLEITDENGKTMTRKIPLPKISFVKSRKIGDQTWYRHAFPFPLGLTVGYYTFKLIVNLGEAPREQEIAVAVCPDEAYIPPALEGDGKRAGVVIALYGLRSAGNWGCGDFRDLRAFVGWAAEALDADVVGLNPLHAIPNRQPYNISPYYPWSRFYRNFIYLCIPEIADFAESAEAQQFVSTLAFRQAVENLRNADKVQYEQVARLKREVLEKVFETFLEKHWDAAGKPSRRRKRFTDYIAREGEMLDRFAVFCTLDEHFRREHADVATWRDWPEPFRDPASLEVETFAQTHRRRVLFFKYEQWQIEEQLQAVEDATKAAGMQTGLYLDLALGVDPAGADFWAYRGLLVPGATVGAPPDPLSPEGQDWAFHPPDPHAMRRDGYRLFAQEIRRNCRFGGALRIDHVMRLYRLFWIMKGETAADGVYVEYAPHDLLGILRLESVRNDTLVIGEDLGTVPADFRELLLAGRIFSYRVFLFEYGKDGRFYPPDMYPADSLATVTTHDMVPMAGFWTFRDLELRRTLGLIHDAREFADAVGLRAWDRRRIIDRLVESGFVPGGYMDNPEECNEFTADLHNGVVGFLLSTSAKLAILSQEDLFKATAQQNVPGIVEGYLNWSTKMPFTLEQLRTEPMAIGCAAMFKSWVARTGRAHGAMKDA